MSAALRAGAYWYIGEVLFGRCSPDVIDGIYGLLRNDADL